MSTSTQSPAIFDREKGFESPGEWKRTIALCFAPRTGSNLLARTMMRTGALGGPQEFFNYDQSMLRWAAKQGANTLPEYVKNVVARHTSPNGVFAAKFLPGHWEMIRMSMSHSLIARAGVVVVTRRDVVAQAVSQAIASISGAWTSETAVPESTRIEYDYRAILNALRFIENVYAFWSTHFATANRPYLIATYEDFYNRPETMVQEIGKAFGVPLPPENEYLGVKMVEKQATSRNSDWAAQFRADMASRGDVLAASPFAAYYVKKAAQAPTPAQHNLGFRG